MKRVPAFVLFCLFVCLACNVSAAELTIADSGICMGVVDRTAVGIGDVFDKNIGKLFCFTRVVGPYLEEKGSSVEHVWYYQNTEKFRITLPVKSSTWRTYSSKNIQSFETGDWHVDVLDPQGEVISVFQFFIK